MTYREPLFKVVDGRDRWNRQNEDETLWWPRVLWLDPGVVSGVACVWFDPKAMFGDERLGVQVLAYHEEFLTGPEDIQALRYVNRINQWGGETGLAQGVEKFTPLRVNYDPEFLSPVRIRAKVEMGLFLQSRQPDAPPIRRLLEQQPTDALNTFTTARLKLLRMHTPGPDHVNDAKAHCLLHLRRIKSAGIEGFKRVHGFEEGWFE